MKNLKMVLALVAVLAMAGTTFADFSISVAPEVDLGNGLTSYMVRAGGVLGFKLTIDGAVHQMNYIEAPSPGNGWTETVVSSTFAGDISGPGVAYDTHYMLNSDDVLPTPSTDFSDDETNLGGNPYNCDDGYGGYYTFGMGTFTSDTSVEGFALSEQLAPGTEFMQIVIPTCTVVYIDGVMSEGPGVHYAIQGSLSLEGITITPFPEPSTVLMLITGGLCLWAVRFRRAARQKV